MGVETLPTYEQVSALAEEWLDAGRSQLADGRYHVAFEALRNAAELAAKALILKHSGQFPQEHAVGGLLAKLGKMPARVKGSDLHRLLVKFTVGPYGFDVTIRESDVTDALRIAERMVAGL